MDHINVHTFSRHMHLKFLPLLMVLAGISAVPAKDLSVETGAQLYLRFCASCHGKHGAGDGIVAPYLKLSPPDLRLMARRNGGTFPAERAHRIIDGREDLPPHGERAMPVWGTDFAIAASGSADARAVAESSISRLVEYLQSIQKN
jgi:mono/diheme cytochrome c family protein